MDTCDGDDDEEDEYSDDEDYDDDDDESWKVRRAAAKVLSSIVSTASEATLTEYYDAVTSKLLSRTKDREPSVQLDIFSVLGDIVRVSGRFLENDPDSNMGAKLRASTWKSRSSRRIDVKICQDAGRGFHASQLARRGVSGYIV